MTPYGHNQEQRSTIVNAVLGVVLLLVALQLWLLVSSVNAWLGGDDTVALPALCASVVSLAINLGAVRYLF